jgi:hypothetical protein
MTEATGADERAAPSTHVRIATVQRATQVETVDVALP